MFVKKALKLALNEKDLKLSINEKALKLALNEKAETKLWLKLTPRETVRKKVHETRSTIAA